MIVFETAQEIALAYVSSIQQRLGEAIVLGDTIHEEDFGWIFYYQTKSCLETGDFRRALAGNAPIIVSRHTGEVTVTGTAESIEYYIQKYRDEHPL